MLCSLAAPARQWRGSRSIVRLAAVGYSHYEPERPAVSDGRGFRLPYHRAITEESLRAGCGAIEAPAELVRTRQLQPTWQPLLEVTGLLLLAFSSVVLRWFFLIAKTVCLLIVIFFAVLVKTTVGRTSHF